MRYGRRDIKSAIHSVIDFLSQQGLITSGALPTVAAIPPVLQYYLGYLRSESNLIGVFPPIHSYKLPRVPSRISDKDDRKTLAGIDRTTSLRLHDFAIIPLLHPVPLRILG